ncbi:thermonuclease family protein [Lentzea sp. NPDC055074]
MPHASEPTTPAPSPGIVRRFWWRSGQRARLAIACTGVLGVLAVTGAAGFSGQDRPGVLAPAAAAAVHRGDSFEVTVRAVSDVDSFEGVEPDTGRAFGARVAGVSPAPCWQSQSLAVAENLLRGKKVRLTVKKEGETATDRLVVDVRLPDGSDYAKTIVGDGTASADLAARGDLAADETAARQQRRGLWSTGCKGYQDDLLGTTSSVPLTSSTTPVPTTTTTTPPPPPPPTQKPTPKPPPPPETTEPDDDAEWLGRFVGKRCFLKGATKTSPKGSQVVCTRGARDQLRWQRAD